jgi:hypothetical protein
MPGEAAGRRLSPFATGTDGYRSKFRGGDATPGQAESLGASGLTLVATAPGARLIRHPPAAHVPTASRPRRFYLTLLVGTIALGLASRRFAAQLPPFIAAYAGDALWAAMVFWLAAIAFPRARTGRLAAAALTFAIAIEVSQLLHAPWIDRLREAPLAGLVFGYGFLWSDLVCYAVGVAAAALVDRALAR